MDLHPGKFELRSAIVGVKPPLSLIFGVNTPLL
jgi:hypothetical protein